MPKKQLPIEKSIKNGIMYLRGRLAQLVRALGLHPRGQGFESSIVHIILKTYHAY